MTNRIGARKKHLLLTVKPARDGNNRSSYRELWWVFGEPRRELRPALKGLSRYIATVDTATHRIFQFLPVGTICDDKVVIIASQDAYHLGVLSSHIHVTWALGQRTRLGQGDDPVYVKVRCFSPFPFPAPTETQKTIIRSNAETIDEHRKRVLAAHPNLTLTGLYNVLEKLRAGISPTEFDPDDRAIFDDGLVLVLKELHDQLDGAVANAYGFAHEMSEEEILMKLVALNEERAQEEARGLVRWLRPEYQVPLFGSPKEKAELDLGGVAPGQEVEAAAAGKPAFPTDDDVAQTAAVMAVLAASQVPLGPESVTTSFRQGRRGGASSVGTHGLR
jgi:hypothetical protein